MSENQAPTSWPTVLTGPTTYRWLVAERRHEMPTIYHMPDSGMWSVYNAVDVARHIAARNPCRPGPNGPIDSVEPVQAARPPSSVVLWHFAPSGAGWRRGIEPQYGAPYALCRRCGGWLTRQHVPRAGVNGYGSDCYERAPQSVDAAEIAP